MIGWKNSSESPQRDECNKYPRMYTWKKYQNTDVDSSHKQNRKLWSMQKNLRFHLKISFKFKKLTIFQPCQDAASVLKRLTRSTQHSRMTQGKSLYTICNLSPDKSAFFGLIRTFPAHLYNHWLQQNRQTKKAMALGRMQMYSLIWAFTVSIWHKALFTHWPSYIPLQMCVSRRMVGHVQFVMLFAIYSLTLLKIMYLSKV